LYGEIQKAISGMRLGVGIIVLAALGGVGLWMSGTIGNEVSTGAKVGAIVLFFVVGAWLRNRWRRRLMDMRDSALW